MMRILEMVFGRPPAGDLSRHRLHSIRYEDLCM